MPEPERSDRAAIFAREAAFHDELAAHLDPARMGAKPIDAFDATVLAELPDLAGKSVLEVGCGDGTLSLVLAARGARVTAFDLSPGMIAIAKERAAIHAPGADVTFLVGPFEEVELSEHSFDFVLGKFILHHVDLDLAAQRVKQWLKPGGEGFFLETSGFNPVLRFARTHFAGRAATARYSSDDEHPLSRAEAQQFAFSFRTATIYHPVMWLLRMTDRHIMKWRSPRFTRLTGGFDDWLWRFRRLRALSYFLAIRVGT